MSVVKVTSVGPVPLVPPVQLEPGALTTDTASTVKPLGTDTLTQPMSLPPGVTVTVTFVATPTARVEGDAEIDQGWPALATGTRAIARLRAPAQAARTENRLITRAPALGR